MATITKHVSPAPEPAYWATLAKVAIRGLTDEQADTIGAMSYEASLAGENPAVWHQSAKLFGNKCSCVPCRRVEGK